MIHTWIKNSTNHSQRNTQKKEKKIAKTEKWGCQKEVARLRNYLVCFGKKDKDENFLLCGDVGWFSELEEAMLRKKRVPLTGRWIFKQREKERVVLVGIESGSKDCSMNFKKKKRKLIFLVFILSLSHGYYDIIILS